MPRPVKPAGLATPGLNWRARANGGTFYWVARPDLVERGYSLKSARLWPPTASRRLEPTPDEWNEMASSCTRLQGQMLEWGNCKAEAFDPLAIYNGSMRSLVKVYRTDPDSPFQELRTARHSYSSSMDTLDVAVGDARVLELTFRDFKRWHKEFCKPEPGGLLRKPRGHRLMTTVRIVMSFGALVKLPGCEEAKAVLSGMEFPNPKKRSVFITAPQCIAHRAKAHEMGFASVAFVDATMFELGVRQKDMLGETLPMSEPGLSDVTYHGRKWLYGMHSGEVSPDLIWTHRLSKSLRGRTAILDPNAGKLEQFDLRAYSMVMEEIGYLKGKTGAIVINERTGRPWNQSTFGLAWRKIARAAGIPDHVQCRDFRAGSITEGRKAGNRLEDMRIHAGHSRLQTTEGYDRTDLETRNNVAQLRTKHRSKTA